MFLPLLPCDAPPIHTHSAFTRLSAKSQQPFHLEKIISKKSSQEICQSRNLSRRLHSPPLMRLCIEKLCVRLCGVVIAERSLLFECISPRCADLHAEKTLQRNQYDGDGREIHPFPISGDLVLRIQSQPCGTSRETRGSAQTQVPTVKRSASSAQEVKSRATMSL